MTRRIKSWLLMPILVVGILLLLSCGNQIKDQSENTPSSIPSPDILSPTTETTDPYQTASPSPPLATEETEEPASSSTSAETEQTPQQPEELDIVKDVLGLQYATDGYAVECVLPSEFGLPKQIALLPNGDVVITDFSFKRLLILSHVRLSTLVGQGEVQANAVAAMPDGRVCYVDLDNRLTLIEPTTHGKEILGSIPSGERIQALTADDRSIVYAVTKNNKLYEFNPDGERSEIKADLPFEQGDMPTISDMDVAQDGTIYVSGFNYFVAVDSEGSVSIIADDLHYEPTWCEIAPDGKVYIKDIASGVRQINQVTGDLISVEININTGVSDLLALSEDEFLFFSWGTDIICKYNITTGEATPLFIHTVNSHAFAAGDGVFLATPKLESTLKSEIVHIAVDGTKQSLKEFAFDDIQAADVDTKNRLNLYADGRFHRLEGDGSITSVIPNFLSGQRIYGMTTLAVGPDGSWYCITWHPDFIKAWCVNEAGKVTILPISFDKTSFENAYRLADSRIAVGNDGRLAIIVTALGSKSQGPFYQRVYQANSDGTDLIEVANFDSKRIGGMVDITIDHDNNIFIYVCQEETTGGGEVIYCISSDKEISTLMKIMGGRDPKSIDVDPMGNIWFGTTVGVFRLKPPN